MLKKIASTIWISIMGLFVIFILAIFGWPAVAIAAFGYYATDNKDGWEVPIVTILLGVPLSVAWMAYWVSLWNNYVAGL